MGLSQKLVFLSCERYSGTLLFFVENIKFKKVPPVFVAVVFVLQQMHPSVSLTTTKHIGCCICRVVSTVSDKAQYKG